MDRSFADRIRDGALRGRAAAQVKETVENAKERLGKAKKTMDLQPDPETSPTPESPAPAADNQAPATDFASRRLREATTQLAEAMPLIERAGFKLETLTVEVGVPPRIMPRFSVVKDVPDAEREALADEAGANRTGHAVLQALFKAGRLKRAIRIGGLDFSHVEILVGIMPKVRLVFSS